MIEAFNPVLACRHFYPELHVVNLASKLVERKARFDSWLYLHLLRLQLRRHNLEGTNTGSEGDIRDSRCRNSEVA